MKFLKPKVMAKALAALLTAAGTWVGTSYADGHIDAEEWGLLGGVVVSGIVVWLTPNKDPDDPAFPAQSGPMPKP